MLESRGIQCVERGSEILDQMNQWIKNRHGIEIYGKTHLLPLENRVYDLHYLPRKDKALREKIGH